MKTITAALAFLALALSACVAHAQETGAADVFYHPKSGKYRDADGERVHVPDPIARSVRRERREERRERVEERRERQDRFDRDHDRDGDADRVDGCRERQAAIGEQWATEGGARDEAIKQWSAVIRFTHGERYMDFTNARAATATCVRSSVGSIAGAVFHRCRIVAAPCLAPSIKVDR